MNAKVKQKERFQLTIDKHTPQVEAIDMAIILSQKSLHLNLQTLFVVFL